MREAARWRRAKAEEFASDNIARHRSNRAMVAIQVAAKFVEQLRDDDRDLRWLRHLDVDRWPIETLRGLFESRLDRQGGDTDAELAGVLGPDTDADTYWEQAGANLKAGRIRLVFVADEIPRELRRVVEFLNEQMTAHVIAIEVKQYVGPDGLRTLVPRAIGQTAAAETRKGSREKRQWDEASFLAELEAKRGSADAQVARELIEWARVNLPRLTWGTGGMTGSFLPGARSCRPELLASVPSDRWACHHRVHRSEWAAAV